LIKDRIDIEKHSVYIRLLSDISPGSVKAKIAGELKNRPSMGHFICYFEVSGMLCYWTYEELRAIIGTGQKKITRPRLSGTGFGWPGWRVCASPTIYNTTSNHRYSQVKKQLSRPNLHILPMSDAV
jgi:hypothetical protein